MTATVRRPGWPAGKALAIAGVQLRRLFRDRSNIFWVIIAPLLFVFVLGLLFGGGQAPRLGVVQAGTGPVADQLTAALGADDRIEVVHYDDPDRLRTEVERGMVHGGLVVPADLDSAVRGGGTSTVDYLARAEDPFAADVGIWVRTVVDQQAAAARAAQVATAEGAGTFPENLDRAATLPVPGVTVTADTVGEAAFPEDLSPFAPLAPSMLLLYVFLTSLTAALGMIEARRLGVTRRIYATPTSAGTIVAGEAIGRLGIALTQGLIVVLGSALLFGVEWGDPVGVTALLVLFCVIGSGAAMLLGASLRNEGPALGISLGLGLGLAALGGAMMPLEAMGDTARTIARFTPHAWGYEGFVELVRHGGTLTDILPQLGALGGFAVVLFAAGVWQLRRTVAR